MEPLTAEDFVIYKENGNVMSGGYSVNSIILNNLTVNSVKNAIEKLIKNSNLRIKLQLRSYKKFKLTNNFISKKIDNYRQLLIKS